VWYGSWRSVIEKDVIYPSCDRSRRSCQSFLSNIKVPHPGQLVEGGDGRLRPWAAKWASKISLSKSATGLPSLKSSTTGSLTRVSTQTTTQLIQDHPKARRSKRAGECSWSSTTSSQPSVDVAFTANQYCGYHGYNCYVRHNPKLYWSTWYKEGTTWFSPLSPCCQRPTTCSRTVINDFAFGSSKWHPEAPIKPQSFAQWQFDRPIHVRAHGAHCRPLFHRMVKLTTEQRTVKPPQYTTTHSECHRFPTVHYFTDS
jgi:hypothetical protein